MWCELVLVAADSPIITITKLASSSRTAVSFGRRV